MKTSFLPALVLFLLLGFIPMGCHPTASSPTTKYLSFSDQVDAAAKRIPHERLQVYLDKAHAIASGKILSRAQTRDDLFGRSDKRTINGAMRVQLLEQTYPEAAEAFALAMTDSGAGRQLLNELGLVASAYRITHDEFYRDYLIRQLTEVATWNPFQRPGYSAPYQHGKIPSEGEGAWLGTGYTVHTVAVTLDLLPKGTLPAPLEDSLRAALRREIHSLATDWKAKKPWFVKEDRPDVNQALVPVSSIVTAGLLAGDATTQADSAFARSELERGMAQFGSDGTMNEGFLLALADSGCDLAITRRFLARAGDPLANHSFFLQFPKWIAFYFQPGGYYANAFDTFTAQRGNYNAVKDSLTRLAAISQSPELHWLVRDMLGGPSTGFYGLLVEGSDIVPVPPDRRALTADHSRMFLWRSGWSATDSGLWLRGSHPRDFHAHSDRGHVNFIAHGQAVLIEAGTTNYLNPRKAKEFDSVLGHNVLQVGDSLRQIPADIPIDVHRAESSGGEATIEAGSAYPEVDRWTRTVHWEQDRVTIHDTVILKPGIRQTLTFRWHLPADQPAQIHTAPDGYRAILAAGETQFPAAISTWPYKDEGGARDVLNWPEIQFHIQSKTPLQLTSVNRPDHTLKYRRFDNQHTVVEVRTTQPVTTLEIATTIHTIPPHPPATQR